MKAVLVVAALGLIASQAKADGFVCNALDTDLTVKVYNHVNPELGTRNPAIMVVSDPSVNAGRKTIARFTDANLTLAKRSSVFEARVDLRFNDSGRQGENIGGTKLGELKKIILNVDHVYNMPLDDGDVVEGEVTLVKRNGELVHLDMTCQRYLKN